MVQILRCTEIIVVTKVNEKIQLDNDHCNFLT